MADNLENKVEGQEDKAEEKNGKNWGIVIVLGILLILGAAAYLFISDKLGEDLSANTETLQGFEQSPQNVAVGNVDTAVAEKPTDATIHETSSKMGDTTLAADASGVSGPKKDLTIADIEPIIMKGAESLVAVLSFKFNEDTTSLAELDALSKEVLQKLNGKTKMVIVGHTDTVGSGNYNQQLSERRAAFVANTMKDLASLSFGVIGYGETKPIADNTTAEGRSKNRRVEIYVQ